MTPSRTTAASTGKLDLPAGARAVALDFASSWEDRGGIWRYGIELARALVAILDTEQVIIPVYDRLPESQVAELTTTKAQVSSSVFSSSYDRLESLQFQKGRFISWKAILPLIYRPTVRRHLFRSALRGAGVYHAMFECRGQPRRGVTVGTIHDLIPWVNHPVTDAGSQRMQRMAADHRRWAELVIVPSAATRDDLINHAGFPEERVRVVHHGIDPSRFSSQAPVDRALLERHRLREGKYLLYVSALAPHKNVERMVAAFLEVVGARNDIPMVLAGSVQYSSPYLNAVLADGTDRVRHIGYVSDAELPGLYRGARALVHVALAEGFGFSPLEALSCGCPVIVSRRAAAGEVVGEAGLQVDPLDVNDIARGIRTILEDDALHAVLQERGPRHSGQFTWQRCARETLAVYREAFDRFTAGDTRLR